MLVLNDHQRVRDRRRQFVGPSRSSRAACAQVHGFWPGGPVSAPEIARWTEAQLSDDAALRARAATASRSRSCTSPGQSSAARSFEAPEETFPRERRRARGRCSRPRAPAPESACSSSGTRRSLPAVRARHAARRGFAVPPGEPIRAQRRRPTSRGPFGASFGSTIVRARRSGTPAGARRRAS